MRKIIFFLAVFESATGFGCFSQDTNLVTIPHGRIVSFGYAASKIFPGTKRIITVYIPAQIDSSVPACVYVQQDGFFPEQKVNLTFDTLIARKEIPVMVGVFVEPGNLPSLDSNTIGRPNRSFEYDGLGDTYARFLLEEILPGVEKNCHLNLSKKGNDRCIAGLSSGGIASFNVAWERPDAFTRVYCVSGSFVSFRGGNEFPTLVRKTEAKPIRAFLTTGTYDMENCAGKWTLLDMEMDKALKFSGYDYKFLTLEGGHVVGWKEYFTEAMRFLWKDWPSPVKIGLSAPRVRDITLNGESWRVLKDHYNHIYGAATNAKGEVFFADASVDKIYRIALDGIVDEFISNAGFCNGLSFGAKDELYTVSIKTGKIMCYETSGRKTQYADGINGRYVLARPDGGLYVTGQPGFSEINQVWSIKDGKKTLMDDNLKFPTGIAMTPDKGFLTIAEKNSHSIYSYQIAPDGKLMNKERFFNLQVREQDDNAGTEAICYDREGHLYVATFAGIQVCAWDGPTQVILPLPSGHVTAMCFGGTGMDTLFAFCGDKIYMRKLKNHGIGAFSPWTAMKPGSL